MKKYLPFILLGVGLLAVIIGIIVVKNLKKQGTDDESDIAVPEIPADQRPSVSLTPTNDGHWLNFVVSKTNVKGAASMDYELVYSVKNGGQQGVPGTVKLDGSNVERKLLLGSESSGKFRYDEGVETGTMTLRFRNSSGKLIGKLSTTFTLAKKSLPAGRQGVYEVTMDTFADGIKTFSSK